MSDEIVIPDKPAFKAAEVCELLKLQPYVLKSWENEFKDLGVSKTPGGPRVYRRADVERAVRIRELMLRDGLTLAGVRRRLEQEAATTSAEDELIAEIATRNAPQPAAPRPVDRERVAQLKQGLKELLETLSRPAARDTADATAPALPLAPPPVESSPAPAAPRTSTRELTVEPDGAPSLFGDESTQAEPTIASEPKPKRKRNPRPVPPATD